MSSSKSSTAMSMEEKALTNRIYTKNNPQRMKINPTEDICIHIRSSVLHHPNDVLKGNPSYNHHMLEIA